MMQPNENQGIVDKKIAPVAPTGPNRAYHTFDYGYCGSRVFSTSRDANDSCGECSLSSMDDDSIYSLFCRETDSVCSSVSLSHAKSDSICIPSYAESNFIHNQLHAETEITKEECGSKIIVSSEEDVTKNSDCRQENDFSTDGQNISPSSINTVYIDVDENPTLESHIVKESTISLNRVGCYCCRGLFAFVKCVMCLFFVYLGVTILYLIPFFNGI